MQKNRQTALLGRGASAPHKRFHRRGKPWRRGGFADPEHSNTEGWKPPLAAGTQKERHDQRSCLSFGAPEGTRTHTLKAREPKGDVTLVK